MLTALEIAAHLDALLETSATPDYSPALNGLQLDARGPVRRVAAAVDLSRRTIEGAIAEGANLLVVHHGMFWGGAQRLVGAPYERLRLLMEHDVAVYSSHIPLDRHPELGNNVLLARALGLAPTGGFGEYKGVTIGVRGESELPTSELVRRADEFARDHGGLAIATEHEPTRTTRRWAVLTGGGASPETIREATSAGVDTLIVGEGPHHTAVDAPEQGLVIVYAGHYATET
ncbi:MAG TPA: Nif3-like dinuclear metal center hexameric protein, partial [Gemmatimonadaceae bacterium]|nr:Nif3-like dinuclear metal center hexameric protein [Gemmatimonadaceae bacterium]